MRFPIFPRAFISSNFLGSQRGEFNCVGVWKLVAVRKRSKCGCLILSCCWTSLVSGSVTFADCQRLNVVHSKVECFTAGEFAPVALLSHQAE
jgi:hypothetical protein